MINFDSLPKDKPNALPAKGRYFATIVAAEMKQPADQTKNPYLNLRLSLKNEKGANAGTIFDRLSESDKPLMQYKLQRFLRATDIEFSGSFTLKDIQKIVMNKELIVDVTISAQQGYPDKAEIDLFTGDMYYKLSEAKDLFEGVSDDVIKASDADDANVAEEF